MFSSVLFLIICRSRNDSGFDAHGFRQACAKTQCALPCHVAFSLLLWQYHRRIMPPQKEKQPFVFTRNCFKKI
ncbi:MAG TPA: hypothetical protein DDY98_02635 [Ruminococcaceae bacterium]|nr:hypothetical protein [Oscillospiraceae bacterium]